MADDTKVNTKENVDNVCEISSESNCIASESDNPLTNEVSNQTTNSQEQISGWLLKRARFSRKWRKHWFLLDRDTLRYGNSDKDVSKKIVLESARILESNKDDKPHTFSVQPRTGKRTYYLQADSEIVRNKWMQAICFAKMANNSENRNSSCAIL